MSTLCMTQCDPPLQNLGYAHDEIVSFPTPLSNGLKRINFALFSMTYFQKDFGCFVGKKRIWELTERQCIF